LDIGAVATIRRPIGQVLITARLRLGLAFMASCLCAGLCSCSDPGTVTAQVNLQHAPANESEVLATIPKGSFVKVRDCTNGWCRASWNGRNGYILTKNVRIGGSAHRATDTDRRDDTHVDDDMSVPDASNETGPSD